MLALADDTYSSQTTVTIRANEVNFVGGKVMRVRCTARISPDLYWKTSEVALRMPDHSQQHLLFKTAASKSINPELTAPINQLNRVRYKDARAVQIRLLVIEKPRSFSYIIDSTHLLLLLVKQNW